MANMYPSKKAGGMSETLLGTFTPTTSANYNISIQDFSSYEYIKFKCSSLATEAGVWTNSDPDCEVIAAVDWFTPRRFNEYSCWGRDIVVNLRKLSGDSSIQVKLTIGSLTSSIIQTNKLWAQTTSSNGPLVSVYGLK